MLSPASLTTSLALALLSACAHAPSPAGTAQPTSLERENTALARRVVERVLSAGDTLLARQLYAADFQNRTPSRNLSFDEDQAAAAGWRSAFPDAVMTIDQLIARNDRVVVLWTATGTNTGTGMGLPATGRRVRLRGITIWRMRDGRVAEEWSAFDQHAVLRQLGLAP